MPVPAARVWQSGATDASAVVIDIAGPVPFAVDGARLAALAQGGPPPWPHEDPDVVALAHVALAAEPVVAAYRLLPGEDGTDLTLCLVPEKGRGSPGAPLPPSAPPPPPHRGGPLAHHRPDGALKERRP